VGFSVVILFRSFKIANCPEESLVKETHKYCNTYIYYLNSFLIISLEAEEKYFKILFLRDDNWRNVEFILSLPCA
jgi:hypothetical protein